jgi:hypothetical protein
VLGDAIAIEHDYETTVAMKTLAILSEDCTITDRKTLFERSGASNFPTCQNCFDTDTPCTSTLANRTDNVAFDPA